MHNSPDYMGSKHLCIKSSHVIYLLRNIETASISGCKTQFVHSPAVTGTTTMFWLNDPQLYRVIWQKISRCNNIYLGFREANCMIVEHNTYRYRSSCCIYRQTCSIQANTLKERPWARLCLYQTILHQHKHSIMSESFATVFR